MVRQLIITGLIEADAGSGRAVSHATTFGYRGHHFGGTSDAWNATQLTIRHRADTREAGMRIGLSIVGGLLLLIGLIWMGQGANLIGGSFMTGQKIWLAIGSLAAFAGSLLLGWANGGQRRP